VHEAAPEFQYEMRLLPRGRFTFRRWRYELWHGAVLRSSGWRMSPRDAERALRTAAAYWTHQALGLPGRPERARALDQFVLGGTVRIECGGVGCVLRPRGWVDEAA
jgi:hypothetical protein